MTDVGIKLYAESTTPNTYAMLVPVVSAPATGSTPGKIENTTLDSPKKTYDMDRPELPQMDFTYNYNTKNESGEDVNHYEEVKAKVDATTAKNYMIVYPDKHGTKFSATGTTWINSVSKGSEIECTVSFVLASMDDVADASTMIS